MRIGRNSLQLWHWSGCNEVQVITGRNATATFISCAHILTPRQQTHTHIHKRTYNYTYTHTPAQLKRLPCYCCCFVAKGKYCLGQWCNNYFVGMWCELRLAAVGVRWSGITRVATTRLPLNFTVLFFFCLICFCPFVLKIFIVFCTLAPLIEIRFELSVSATTFTANRRGDFRCSCRIL